MLFTIKDLITGQTKVLNVDRIVSIEEIKPKGGKETVSIAYNYSMSSADSCPTAYFIDMEQWKGLRAVLISRSILINI